MQFLKLTFNLKTRSGAHFILIQLIIIRNNLIPNLSLNNCLRIEHIKTTQSIICHEIRKQTSQHMHLFTHKTKT